MKKSKKNKPQQNRKRKPDRNKKPRKPAVIEADAGGIGMDLVGCLKGGLEHQQAGDPAKAEEFYRKALQIEPGNSIAIQLLGRLAQQRGAHQEAVDFFSEALAGAPGNAEILNNLGNSLIELEQYEEAIVHLERALALEPDYAQAHNNLGAALTSAERPEEAIEHITRSLDIIPDNALAHNNLGNALKDIGHFNEAVEHYNQALKLRPDFPDAYYNLGLACEGRDLFDDAINAYRVALKMKPDFAQAHFSLGNIHMDMERVEDARGQYDKVRQENPACAEAQNNLGIAVREAGLVDAAELAGQSIAGRNSEFDESIARYKQAVAIKPDYAVAHNSLGLALALAGRLAEAEQSCRRAIELDAGFAEAHRNLAICLFMAGDVSNGWEEYEWRSKSEEVESPKRDFPQAPWDGSSLEGKSIMLWGEQGIGDEVRFASMISDVLETGATVSIECTPRLVDLFSRSFPQATVYGYPKGEHNDVHFDFQCPFPGLGRFLRPTVEAFAAQRQAYLVPDRDRLEFWGARLAGISSRPKIGINWRSMAVTNKWKHYYAAISELAPLMAVAGVDFVNMMYDVTDDELAEFEELYGVRLLAWDDIDLKNDIDDVAALNASLDMVVSCLSSVTELSGALGVPTLGFIGDRKEPIMLGTGDAIWYPNTKYFSKNRNESWRPVLEDIAQEIRRTFSLSQGGGGADDGA